MFTQAAERAADTPILRELKLEAAKAVQEPVWKGAADRHFISFLLDSEDDFPGSERQVRPPSAPPVQVAKVGGQIANEAPPISGTIGRFDMHDGARLQGTRLNSIKLAGEYSKSPGLAQNQCVRLCSGDKDCLAFEIDQVRNICATYSSIWKTQIQPNWTHGIWK